jgi:hypothetical protein
VNSLYYIVVTCSIFCCLVTGFGFTECICMYVYIPTQTKVRIHQTGTTDSSSSVSDNTMFLHTKNTPKILSSHKLRLTTFKIILTVSQFDTHNLNTHLGVHHWHTPNLLPLCNFNVVENLRYTIIFTLSLSHFNDLNVIFNFLMRLHMF